MNTKKPGSIAGLKNKNGGYTWFLGEATPRINDAGKFIGYAAAFIEMSPGTLNENFEKIVAGQSEVLTKLAEKLVQKNQERDRNNAELESFTYIASHDLQEPLRKIQSFSKLIMAKDSDQLSGSTKDYFFRIMGAAERMQRLIDDLLSYSGTKFDEILFETVDLNEVLEDVKLNFKEVIEEKQVVIQSESLPTLKVIKFQMNQLFTNILSNALKFSKENDPINISIHAAVVPAEDIRCVEEVNPGNYHKISFHDNGIGFEQQYEKRIFELFQRLHGKNEYIGTGIGLAICKKIVHNHHGCITATGQPGEGSTFNIYLPAAAE